MRMQVGFSLCVALALTLGCGDSDSGEQGSSSGSGASAANGGAGGSGGIVIDTTGGAGGGGQNDNCAEAATYVYVIDIEDRLYRFDPTVTTPAAFELVGTMNCGAGSGPNSMSVARDGTAYVLYGTDGGGDDYDCAGVYKVGIQDAACQGPSSFQCGSAGFHKFGMGYATDSAGTTEETLYLANSFSGQLGSVDFATGSASTIGPMVGPAEFTGNALGELWGFFPQNFPPQVVQVDKATGASLQTFTLNDLPPPFTGGYAYAFAYWGDAFYIFYWIQGFDASTNVYRLDKNGTLTSFIDNSGIIVVGAGVSTCAPTEAPK